MGHAQRHRLPAGALRAARISIAMAMAASLAGAALLQLAPGMSGNILEQAAFIALAITASSGSVLIVEQGFRNGTVSSLFVCATLAWLATGLLNVGSRALLEGRFGVGACLEVPIIQLALFSTAFYLLIWDRGRRIILETDSTFESAWALAGLWPMPIIYALLLGAEYYS